MQDTEERFIWHSLEKEAIPFYTRTCSTTVAYEKGLWVDLGHVTAKPVAIVHNVGLSIQKKLYVL